jgi:alpha-methylacyl-CoA racemase
LRLTTSADVVVEGFRPGVMERLGLGPDVCLAEKPALVYARMTGWGQSGPMAQQAGHDINYIALAGALHHIRRRDQAPVPPLNLVGDFGGGALYLVVGILAALLHARHTGEGQVIDAAMVDGVASLLAPLCGFVASGLWSEAPGGNFLDTGAPYYDVYETADGQYISVGAIEPEFYAQLLGGLELAADDLPPQDDQASWPAMKERFAAIFRQRTRAEWATRFAGTDACVVPVLSPAEAATHPQLASRQTYLERDGILQPAPAPRFSETPSALGSRPSRTGADTDQALARWGFSPAELAELQAAGALGSPVTLTERSAS